MSERLDRIEKILEDMAERQARTDARYEEMSEIRKSDRAIIERLDNSLERHDKILANLEANQIVIGKAMEGIRTRSRKNGKDT